jgi:hypothetical protein
LAIISPHIGSYPALECLTSEIILQAFAKTPAGKVAAERAAVERAAVKKAAAAQAVAERAAAEKTAQQKVLLDKALVLVLNCLGFRPVDECLGAGG